MQSVQHSTEQHATEQQIVHAYLRGNSICTIASWVGVKSWKVRLILRRERVMLRSRGGVNRVHKRKIELTYSIVQRIKIDGATHAQLCKELGISRNTIKRYWNSAYGKAIREFVFCERLGQHKHDVIQRLQLEHVPDSIIARTVGMSITELRRLNNQS